MEYFTPEFTLGLTATPERMDNQDIFELFEKNVPFELRLRDAISNDLVVPFHYYAIKDKFADYGSNDKARIAREISKEINVEFIAKEIEKHRKPNEKLKAIAFCTSIAHCSLMAESLALEGYNTVALTGSNNLGERIKAFNDLQSDDNPLEIICAIDILNEGVDIPGINMVLFLRPTESQTVFLQQLGRGLRKYPNKDYVTVLDFIGNNYDRSIQIALALGTLGTTTYSEKSYLKDLINSDFDSLKIPGVEIFFDELSKKEIIDFIDKENFNRTDYLKKDYDNFKKYLKKEEYPSHMDFLNSEIAPDLLRFIKSKINNKKNKSYYSFLRKIDEESIPLYSKSQVDILDKISEQLPLVRVDEYIIIRMILNSNFDLNQLENYNPKVNKDTLNHALKQLIKANIIDSNYKLLVDSISDSYKEHLNDLIDYGLNRYDVEFGNYDGKFKLLGNYYKEQVMRVLLQDGLMFMKGTKFDPDGVTYCFIGLKKDSSKQEKLNYKDKFIDSSTFQWESENNTTKTNSPGLKIINTKVVHLFVRKVEEENGITLPFTYFGTGKFTNLRETKNNEYDTLTLDIILDNKVSEKYCFDFNIPDDIIES